MTRKIAVLFLPDNKDLRITYPELSSTEEFRALTNEEMLFVYNYACASSPVIRLVPEKRILRCLEILKDKLSTKQLQEYAKLQFPDKIQFALDRMAKFDLGARMRAKGINEKIFSKIEEYAETELANDASVDDKKRHVDMLANISKILPTLVFQLESGFGVKYVAPEEEEQQENRIPNWESTVQGSKK
jgi:hypothetical protein